MEDPNSSSLNGAEEHTRAMVPFLQLFNTEQKTIRESDEVCFPSYIKYNSGSE
jgi:hypothetical protein